MQRYFLNENAECHQRFFITNKDDIHHMLKVMRYTEGDTIIINFDNQQTFKATIIHAEQKAIEVETIERLEIHSEMPVSLTIASGLIKSDKYEWLLQKATELGVNDFIAVQMDRSVVKLNDQKANKKLERWSKIIKEAAEQSYRQRIPNIKYCSNLKYVYDMISEYDYILMAYEEQAKKGESSQFKKTLTQLKPNDKVLLLFGPEGGFSEGEVALFEPHAHIVGLGPRILRAETAALYALSAISYEIELMR
ncbi:MULTISPECIES: 16S rRNA (uracil(1498)-N(3))-methyltransferase [unclassified Staphylococcus]|uniref:16S rRNA (uracil(1498)-N(3))-methyltransferase n=1 Tax=unclassified Staphylococcus TaxID=91994 RepID=UPI0021D0D78A|nr:MULTISPECIES: 16S rRNA (uracil(1498)-N(3))-methyltransferase [unclassified Staphylococcus]UXR77338.1 16S rRNA (uracil(1498)-N(3))-methyltransferase [Staphylococcus sp. IVB6227]UXR81601.1 16S rRNA (uracil(1498)-N(3))-methyltransferase [Staphylococcus sp. IVB6214]